MPEHVDRDRLYTDLAYRFSYVCEFVEFGAEDQKAIRDAAPHLGPLVPTLVNAVYDKLFTFDITKAAFAARMEGFTGRAVLSGNDLSMDSEQIKFRKDMLSKYLVKLVSSDYNESMLKYLDWVAVVRLTLSLRTCGPF
ncbi:Globin-sensor domain-containing protein [Plasmodiophora brassicae]